MTEQPMQAPDPDRPDQDPPDETPEGGPVSGEPDTEAHEVQEVPEWR